MVLSDTDKWWRKVLMDLIGWGTASSLLIGGWFLTQAPLKMSILSEVTSDQIRALFLIPLSVVSFCWCYAVNHIRRRQLSHCDGHATILSKRFVLWYSLFLALALQLALWTTFFYDERKERDPECQETSERLPTKELGAQVTKRSTGTNSAFGFGTSVASATVSDSNTYFPLGHRPLTRPRGPRGLATGYFDRGRSPRYNWADVKTSRLNAKPARPFFYLEICIVSPELCRNSRWVLCPPNSVPRTLEV